MNKLAVGDLVVLYFADDRLATGKLISAIRVMFNDDQDSTGALQPIVVSDWPSAVALIKARYPKAHIGPWRTVQPEVYHCETGESEAEWIISTNFYASDEMFVREQNDPDRQEFEYEAGWIDWLCEIQENHEREVEPWQR